MPTDADRDARADGNRCRPTDRPPLIHTADDDADVGDADRQRCQSLPTPTVMPMWVMMPKCQSLPTMTVMPLNWMPPHNPHHPDAQSVRACQSLPTMTDPPPCQSLRLSHTRIRTHITHITRYTLHALHTSRAMRVSTKASTKTSTKASTSTKTLTRI